MHEIARGIYAIDGLKVGRSYLVEGHDGLALVDTSSPSAAAGIITAIEGIGRRPEDLRTIVATHYHSDHTGNVDKLKKVTADIQREVNAGASASSLARAVFLTARVRAQTSCARRRRRS